MVPGVWIAEEARDAYEQLLEEQVSDAQDVLHTRVYVFPQSDGAFLLFEEPAAEAPQLEAPRA